jgi:hypothetical protein
MSLLVCHLIGKCKLTLFYLKYDDILKYHGQELLHNNGLKLTQIAQNDSSDTKTMACLAEKTYQDSRTTRIATVIAMFYLPANLVTVCLRPKTSPALRNPKLLTVNNSPFSVLLWCGLTIVVEGKRVVSRVPYCTFIGKRGSLFYQP